MTQALRSTLHALASAAVLVGILCDVAGAQTPGGVTPTFTTATYPGVGGPTYDYDVSAGDFDGDGDLDIAATNTFSGVLVYLNNGSGGFGAYTAFAAGAQANSVAVADFNGNGAKDLVVTSLSGTNNVSVLFGSGTGSFGAPVGFATSGTPGGCVVADFNGDAKMDFALSNRTTKQVSVFIGNGTGGFTGPTTFAVGTAPRGIATGDFNGDGKVDMVTADSGSSSVSILIGNGSGGFAAAVLFPTFSTSPLRGVSPWDLTVADLNLDGKLDVATANSHTNDVSILIGNGLGAFAAPTHFGGSLAIPHGITAVDLNLDGLLDLATANSNSSLPDHLSVLLGNGAGSFSSPLPYSLGSLGNFPQSVIAADFNADGKMDLAAACLLGGPTGVALNTSAIPATMTLSGAEWTTVNGSYALMGVLNGKPWYMSGLNAMYWSSAGYWNIVDDNEQRFTNSNPTVYPPVGGWLRMPFNTPSALQATVP
jgi:hypothetical protein